MKCTAIFLKPTSTYKTPLRSDTLWGAICWGIRRISGEQGIKEFLESYQKEDGPVLSSAFPYKVVDGRKKLFFPVPLSLFPRFKVAYKDGFYKEKVLHYNDFKKVNKFQYISKEALEKLIDPKEGVNNHLDQYTHEKAPAMQIEAVPHNSIDRLKLGTRDEEETGQLFHENEIYWIDKSDKTLQNNTGLFFLIKNPNANLQSAIRYLSHVGIGGNRSTGKGHFDLEFDFDFELKEPDQYNAVSNLSLYHPSKKEIAHYQENKLFEYKLEAREGRSSGNHVGFAKKVPVWYFKEGSVFPVIDKDDFGRNTIASFQPRLGEDGNHITFKPSHTIHQYGKGFMYKLNVTWK